MIFAYTVCTLNYLAHARAFYESFQKHHPNIPFYLGLVDRAEGRVDLSTLPFEVVEVEKLGLANLPEMATRYTILELTCALKAYFGGYFFETYSELSELWYFDTDIQVYSNMSVVSKNLQKGDILITPHFYSPYKDKKHQSERDFLNSGLYNAGFFALKKSPVSKRFLEWWQSKVSHEAYLRFDLGMFLDQLWLNYVPLFFPETQIAKELGLNVGYWNLHEREISQKEGYYWVNSNFPLYFYHFSGYNINAPHLISIHQDRWSLERREDIVPLYQGYLEAVKKYDYDYVSGLKSVFDKKYQAKSVYSKIKNLAKRRTSFVLWKLIRIVEPNPTI